MNWKRIVVAIALLVFCPLLLAQATQESACSVSDQKAAENAAQEFFLRYRKNYSLDDVRDELLSAPPQCHSVFHPPLMDIDKKLLARLDCASIERFEDSGFEFFLVFTEYVMGRENLDVPRDGNEILESLPKEVSEAMKKSPSLRRAFSEQDAGNEQISSESELREISDSLHESAALMREYLNAHPEAQQLRATRLKQMQKDVASSDGSDTKCRISDDQRLYGRPDGTPIIETIVFPYWVVLSQEDGRWKIARLSFMTQ